MQTMTPMVSMINGRGKGGALGEVLRRGTKRDAGDSGLSDIERFEKRLRMLSIRPSLFFGSTPKVRRTDGRTGNEENATKVTAVERRARQYHVWEKAPVTVQPPTIHAPPHEECMHVDDTPDRVYIHDLDAELADDESEGEENKLIFLPDIEKRFSRIPQQVLTGTKESTNENQELVLYSRLNRSQQGQEQIVVKRVIEEARQRARDKAVRLALQHETESQSETKSGTNGYLETMFGTYNIPDYDLDAMDIG